MRTSTVSLLPLIGVCAQVSQALPGNNNTCPPVDQVGTTLQGSSVQGTLLICQYPVGSCGYSPHGTLEEVAIQPVTGKQICPPTPSSTGILSQTFSSSSVSSQRTSISPQTSVSTAKKQISTGALSGIIVAGVLCLLGLALAALILRRRRRLWSYRDVESFEPRAPGMRIVAPFPLVAQLGASHSGRNSSVKDVEGQITILGLETSLVATKNTIVDPEPEAQNPRRSVSPRPPHSPTHLINLLPTEINEPTQEAVGSTALLPSPPASPYVEAQLQASREQINMILARMNALEANTDFAWARCEPPPEYVHE